MVVRAQIGYSPHMGILVLRLGFFVRLFFGLRNVVDALFVFFSVGIDHRSSVTASRVTFSLHVPFLFAIAAHNVRVARAVAARRARAASLRLIGIVERLLMTHSCDLVDVLGFQFIPENGGGLLRLHDGFESGDLLGAFSVIVDGLKLPGELQAFLEGRLASLQNSVTQRIFDTSQEKLVLKEQGHVVYPFGLYLGLSGAGGDSVSDSGHGVGLVVNEPVIGDLDPAQEVVHRFVWVLLQIRKICANRFCGVFGLVGGEELGLDVVPDGGVDVGVPERLPPDDGTLPEAKL